MDGENKKIEDFKIRIMEKENKAMHYYGDNVRSLYMAMAVIMLVSTPFFQDRFPMPAFFSIICVLALSVLAGLTNPKSRKVIIFDFLASILVLLSFGYQTIVSYDKSSLDLFFAINLLISILSVFSAYYSSKTLRGHFLHN